MCYAYAAITGNSVRNGLTPNLCVDTLTYVKFSKQKNVPISGKDFKSGRVTVNCIGSDVFQENPVCWV